MSAWRLTLTVDLEADTLADAEEIGKAIWHRCAPLMQKIDGVRWLLPVGEFKEREPFATAAAATESEND